LCVQWKDGTTTWVSLAELKDSNPLELAEYAVVNGIQDKPAFNWWVKDVMRARTSIISKVKSRYWKTTHKYGVRLPHSVEEALQIDRNTGTTLWQEAILKERTRVCVAWMARDNVTPDEVRRGKVKDMIGYQEITCHIIFDVKPDFTRKARFVANGSTTDAPSSMTYSSVVSRDSIRLMFLVAALNDLDVFACDIGNAYLNVWCKEKIWFRGGTEMGEDKGKVMIVTRALYGLKSSGFAWHQMMSQTLRELEFVPSIADTDV
jgi:Reverse transcriptase (RNA-dependent DNA polymerase)